MKTIHKICKKCGEEKLISEFYFWQRIFGKPRDIFLNIKWFIQRGKRGFADCDTWDFDIYLARIIKEGVSQLKEEKYGFPCDLEEDEWNKILDNIIYTFTEEENILDKNPYNNYDEQKENGWKLFKEYFHNLWS